MRVWAATATPNVVLARRLRRLSGRSGPSARASVRLVPEDRFS